MKALSSICLSVMLLFSFSAKAANTDEGDKPEVPFRPTFSIEAGVGPAPIHLILESRNYSSGIGSGKKLVESGKEFNPRQSASKSPSLSISAAYRPFPRWEFTVTAGFSWVNAELIQHPVFGTAPDGSPRYDWNKTESTQDYLMLAISVTPQARVIWNPRWKVQAYSGFGLGMVIFKDHSFIIPSLVLAGAKFGGKRVYFFAENTYSPFATVLHGGVGVRF